MCVYPCIRLLVIFIEYCSVSKTGFLLLGVCLGHWACIVCDPDKSGERGRRFLQTAQKYTSKMRAQTLSASKQKLKNARSVSIHLFSVTVCRGFLQFCHSLQGFTESMKKLHVQDLCFVDKWMRKQWRRSNVIFSPKDDMRHIVLSPRGMHLLMYMLWVNPQCSAGTSTAAK